VRPLGRYFLAAGLGFVLLATGAGFVLVQQTKVSPEAINASVVRNEELLERAWRLPVAAAYQRQLNWQSNASMCGPASVANVLRSLGTNAATEQTVLAGTGLCRTGYCFLGLTLDELATILKQSAGRTVVTARDLTLEQFREHLRHSNDPDRRYIVNFSRRQIFGAGAGHHSPIGGYLEKEDLVFVLDVNEAFGVWLVESRRLFDAMNTFDGERKRGLLVIQKGA
jgi:hypothetical protein